MKKLFIIIFTLLLSVISYGQTHRFFYTIDMKIDTLKKSKDIVVLDINKDKNVFYSNDYLVKDSINSTREQNDYKLPRPKFDILCSWDKETFSFTDSFGPYGYSYDSVISLKWTLSPDNETKTIKGYTVQKATTSYGDRNWTAWFTTDIPLSYGPYVFYGLPGLVLEVYDDDNEFHFSFAGNKNLTEDFDSEKMLNKYLSGIKKIKREEYAQAKLNYYKSPFSVFKNSKDTDEVQYLMTDDNGQPVTMKYLTEKEKKVQQQLLKYDNPIEREFKIANLVNKKFKKAKKKK